MFGKKALGSKNWKKLLQNLPYGGVLIVEEEGKLTKNKAIRNALVSRFPF